MGHAGAPLFVVGGHHFLFLLLAKSLAVVVVDVRGRGRGGRPRQIGPCWTRGLPIRAPISGAHAPIEAEASLRVARGGYPLHCAEGLFTFCVPTPLGRRHFETSQL